MPAEPTDTTDHDFEDMSKPLSEHLKELEASQEDKKDDAKEDEEEGGFSAGIL